MAKKKTEQTAKEQTTNNTEATDFSSIYKQFKKNTIDPASRKCLTTGHSVIDALLSEGKGLPQGCYIELSSSSGCGKCVTGDSIVFVDGQFKRIEDDIEHVGFTESNEKEMIMSRHGAIHFSHRYKEHVSSVVTISDVHGNKITCTPIHPLLVKRDDGQKEWVKAQDIKLKDKVIMATPYVRQKEIKKTKETLLSYLEGYDLLKSKQYWKYGFMLDISQQNLDVICAELESYGITKSDNWGEYEYTERNLDQYKLYVHQKDGKEDKVYVRIDLDDAALQKHVHCVTKDEDKKCFYRSMELEELIAKIAGIVDSVGNITFNSKEVINKKISLFATEKQDICDIQAMLAILGIVGHQSIVNNCKYPHCLNLTLTSSVILANLIEPYIIIKKNDLRTFIEETKNEQLYMTNHLKVSEICTEARDCFVYDYSIPDSHEFLVNGIVSHNTTLVLDIAKHICEQGYKCAYIDTETALSENLLGKMGLMPYYDDLFWVFNPTTFNAVGSYLDTLVKDPAIKLIVVDSVTALTPDELTQEGKLISDGQIGIQSRYTGNLLKRYRERINNNEKIVVFINQMRTKIPTGYGHAYDAPAGGNAQQFTMDIRLLMKCIETIKAPDGHQIGAINKIWAIKNRYGEPFKEYNVKLMFGKGVDELREYAQWLIDNGVAEKRGGGNYTVMWEGKEIKFKGQPAYEDWIADNADEIKAFIDKNGGLVPLPDDGLTDEPEADTDEVNF
jgi:RecA/RadA recombinase